MNNQNKKIIVRFPPSPTGLLQMGNVRTLLFNFLFAQKNKGDLIVRVEDTDKERSKKEYEEAMLFSLDWLGINYTNRNHVWRQSERTEIYKSKMQELIKNGSAYIAEEQKTVSDQMGDGPRNVVRFKNPGGKIKFTDLIRGEVEIDVSDLGDFIIGRNIEEPVYHLTVVVDDTESGVTHIIRGDDHISNTPRQILLIEALGGTRPIYAHLPLVLAEDKTKLSKRKHGESASLKFYIEKGYEKEAIINFLALIGWNPGTEQEIFTIEELIEQFDITKVQKGSGVFNIEKLNWISREHILRQDRNTQKSKLLENLEKTKYKNHPKLQDNLFVDNLLSILIERIHRWGEICEWVESGEFDYLFESPTLKKDLICWKKSNKEDTVVYLENILDIMEANTEKDKIISNVKELAEKIGKGEILWPLRYCLSGKEKSPDPFTLVKILNIAEIKTRINEGLNVLKSDE